MCFFVQLMNAAIVVDGLPAGYSEFRTDVADVNAKV
jgi:hypothetical protein